MSPLGDNARCCAQAGDSDDLGPALQMPASTVAEPASHDDGAGKPAGMGRRASKEVDARIGFHARRRQIARDPRRSDREDPRRTGAHDGDENRVRVRRPGEEAGRDVLGFNRVHNGACSGIDQA